MIFKGKAMASLCHYIANGGKFSKSKDLKSPKNKIERPKKFGKNDMERK